MLNWIALAFEVLGFTLAALEIYFPLAADKVEHWLDENSSLKGVEFPKPSFKVYILNLAEAILGAFIVFGVISIIEFFYTGIFRLAFKSVSDAYWLIMVIFVMRTLRELVAPIAFFLVALVPRIAIQFANLINPQDRALGGAGIIIAFWGMLIDTFQVAEQVW